MKKFKNAFMLVMALNAIFVVSCKNAADSDVADIVPFIEKRFDSVTHPTKLPETDTLYSIDNFLPSTPSEKKLFDTLLSKFVNKKGYTSGADMLQKAVCANGVLKEVEILENPSILNFWNALSADELKTFDDQFNSHAYTVIFRDDEDDGNYACNVVYIIPNRKMSSFDDFKTMKNSNTLVKGWRILSIKHPKS